MGEAMASLKNMWADLAEIARLPEVTIDLMLRATRENDPFYEKMVRQFHAETRARHRRFPLLRHWRYGVALCPLPAAAAEYVASIESAARRNYKKAQRLGYTFERLDHNRFLADMKGIHASTDVRQGPMPDRIVHGAVKPCNDPPSRTNAHDYPYFGILKDGHLVAYCGGLVAGEAFLIEQLYGHAAHHANGVVPMLLIDTAGYLCAHYPRVKYYVNEMYYGAGETMRRFKRKFGFVPHKVRWELGEG
jgi:hypothetical protein